MSGCVKNGAKVAVIGGGIAGSTIALHLGAMGLEVTLYEKKSTLISGPPMCHLHAGGNLYREISDEQCITLLKESIDLIKLYPFAIDRRPTLIATPIHDEDEPQNLFRRLELLKNEYKALINTNASNQVLGEVEAYYKTYSKEQILALKNRAIPQKPQTLDDWLIAPSKVMDLQSLKFPLIMVQEYGINVFRLGAGITLALTRCQNSVLKLQHTLKSIHKDDKGFNLTTQSASGVKCERFDYIINAAGFRTGEIDDMLGYRRKRYVEFKAAYIASWSNVDSRAFAEIIFHGKRGTPQGMAQFTPYADGYFQLHGMSDEVTLFKDGLVQSSTCSAYPKLHQRYLEKIDYSWSKESATSRTKAAIYHVAQFIPTFKNATVASKPLYGAQQIPGDDATLRAANVTFEAKNYARCEIVKASSALSMADAICEDMIKKSILHPNCRGFRATKVLEYLSEDAIAKEAKTLCKKREYPTSLSKRINAF